MKSLSGRGPRVYSDDLKKKVCNCPLHRGSMVPIEKFWTFKSGRRKGMLLSRCIDGERMSKGREPWASGLVPYSRVQFIFQELEFRLGRAETARRVGLSTSFWARHEDNKKPTCVKKYTVIRAVEVLRVARAKKEARHRDSIRYGAYMRGRKEKIPTRNADFNGPDNTEAERSRARRKLTLPA